MKWLAVGDSSREMLGESNGMVPTAQVSRQQQQASQSQVIVCFPLFQLLVYFIIDMSRYIHSNILSYLNIKTIYCISLLQYLIIDLIYKFIYIYTYIAPVLCFYKFIYYVLLFTQYYLYLFECIFLI